MKLAGQTTLITGADSGTGQQTAIALTKEGANVAISFHTDHTDAETTCKQVERGGGRSIALRMDAGDPTSVNAFFRGLTMDWGSA